jgi:hypothetical protein
MRCEFFSWSFRIAAIVSNGKSVHLSETVAVCYWIGNMVSLVFLVCVRLEAGIRQRCDLSRESACECSGATPMGDSGIAQLQGLEPARAR